MNPVEHEALALWAEIVGTPPPGAADASDLLMRLVESLPPVGYERFTHPSLDDAGFVWPKRA